MTLGWLPYQKILDVDEATGKNIKYYIGYLGLTQYPLIFVNKAPNTVDNKQINAAIAMLEQMREYGYALLRFGHGILDKIENKDEVTIGGALKLLKLAQQHSGTQ